MVTEREEPQAVIGSFLHKVAYPTNYAKHRAADDLLQDKVHHRGRDVLDVFGKDEVLSIQLRGEYLYTANGRGGFRAYDVAQVDQKGFSEKIVTAPVSPLGQRLYVKTKYATAVASPSTLAVDPTRTQRPENEEQKIHPVYAYLYVSDREEGLVVIGNPLDSPNRPGVSTLLDGDPDNNFLERALAFNPDGLLTGAVNITVAGHYAYVLASKGLFVVDLDNPLQPRIVATVGEPHLKQPRAVAIQFRYAFVTDAEGLKVIDVTNPVRPRPVPNAVVPLADARGLYLARTYAYVAAGRQGLAIIDIERPETPTLDQRYDAAGAIDDARDVKVGMTNASLFAYVADGKNGLRVLQLTSPEETPTYLGFSPRPQPRLIATARTHGPALAVSKGTDRDRAADESGQQIAVFNRVGAGRSRCPRCSGSICGTATCTRSATSRRRRPARRPHPRRKRNRPPSRRAARGSAASGKALSQRTRQHRRITMSHRVAWGAVLALVVAAGVVVGGTKPSAPLAPDAVHAQGPYSTGAASCGASNCHGSTKPKADYPKLNENVVWFQKDKHAKAYATLTNEKLKSGVSPSKIATNLKIAKAEASDKCLVCHAVDVKPELRGPKFDISEGVHCDGCHGPAEKWLEPHAEKGWTHEQSVKLGMYDTKSFLLRAEKCVSCHLQIDAEMVAAGHPDLLAFELDTFSATMPPHWRDKGTWAGTKAWATGQVTAARGGQAARGPRLRQRLRRPAHRRAGQGTGPRRGGGGAARRGGARRAEVGAGRHRHAGRRRRQG